MQEEIRCRKRETASHHEFMRLPCISEASLLFSLDLLLSLVTSYREIYNLNIHFSKTITNYYGSSIPSYKIELIGDSL